MKILVIGKGGREHTLVHKISLSPMAHKIFCAPGNAGTSGSAENLRIEADDIPQLKEFAMEEQIDLTIVGPEEPLVLGIVDEFEKAGLKIYGPRKNAAILEGSKVFAKELLQANRIPTAKFELFSNVEEAKFYIDKHGLPAVIKVDGLAAGKGVKVCHTENDAYLFLNEIEAGKFGAAGDKFIIEECLKGETQPILVRMKSDLVPIILMALEGKLDTTKIEWDKRPALCVVMASNGYPESYIKGFPISGIHDAEKIGAIVFHAGTIKDNEGNIVTDGGRVLGVTALGGSLKEAKETAYAAVKKISWKGCFYRTDIDHRK